jgi:hypothetical protein
LSSFSITLADKAQARARIGQRPTPIRAAEATGRREQKIRNLHSALAEGTAGDTVLFREALHGLESQREESIRLLSLLDIEAPPLRRVLSKDRRLPQSSGLAS